jgi:hypothetical protein
MHPPFAKAWAAQWQAAGPALDEVARRELAAMTPVEALAASDALLALADPHTLDDARLLGSGLVEQQRLFARLR